MEAKVQAFKISSQSEHDVLADEVSSGVLFENGRIQLHFCEVCFLGHVLLKLQGVAFVRLKGVGDGGAICNFQFIFASKEGSKGNKICHILWRFSRFFSLYRRLLEVQYAFSMSKSGL